jgi:type IV secretory pathway VirB2 component (pilin)
MFIIMKNLRNRLSKPLSALAVTLLAAQSALAQDLTKAFSAVDGITTSLKNNYGKVQALIFIIAGVLAIIAALQVIPKFQSGDPNASKHAVGWVIGIIFLIVAGVFIKTLFGIT